MWSLVLVVGVVGPLRGGLHLTLAMTSTSGPFKQSKPWGLEISSEGPWMPVTVWLHGSRYGCVGEHDEDL